MIGSIRKKTIFFVFVFFSISFFPLNAFGKDIAPLFNVDLTPISAGSVAEYHIYGSYSPYDKVNIMKLYFREDTSFKYPGAPSGSIVVNGEKVLGAQFREVPSEDSVELTLYLSKYINSSTPIDILIKKEAGLVNPITPATCYKVRVLLCYNSVELGVILSNTYRISSSQVQDVFAMVEPPIRGMKAEYKVSFVTGVRGTLTSGSGFFRVKFAEGTSFPSIISQSSVLVNGKNAVAVYKDSDNPFTLQIYTPSDIPANYFVAIVFLKTAGIINTSNSGIYVMSVSTSSEPEWVDSEPFEIYEPQVHDLNVTLSPDSIALSPELYITFTTSAVGYLAKDGKVYVEFPHDFNLSFLSFAETVFLNGKPAQASFFGQSIQIVVPEIIPASSEVTIKILKETGIINPVIPGNYEIFVYTDSDSFRTSFMVKIEDSTVLDVSFSAFYSGLNSVNEFKILFKTGPVYNLSKNIDSIIIKFDNGFSFPETAVQGIILVNGKPSQSVSLSNRGVYIILPEDIPSGNAVEVIIPESFSIRNPGTLGEYGITVSTSKEPKEIESNKLKITLLPVVEFTISPQAPDGQNGYYKTAPEIRLSTSNGTKVFYKIDEGEFKEYSESFKVSEGMHVVFAYAVDSGNNKGDTVKKEFSVDNTPPQIKFDNSLSDPYFKGSPGILTGSVSEPCTLKINEAVLELKNDLNFTVELNVYDEMPIAVYLRDLAGNARTLLYTAHIDNSPPVISYVNGENSRVTETTESSYTIQLKLSEKGKIFVNGKEALFDGTTYTYFASLTDGDNHYEIRAVDSAGNETTETLNIKKVSYKVITLQIGNRIASIGSDTVELDAPPFIENGYTLVPIRFISETFGAEVQWNEMLKVITIIYKGRTIQIQIGSTVAILDNSISKIDVAPKIVSNRTFVPLRFISETFGAKVDWDAATRTITITYTP